MKRKFAILLQVCVAAALLSCSQEIGTPAIGSCDPSAETLRVLNDAVVSVHHSNGQFFLVEQFTYDTKLIPCEDLPTEFRVDGLVLRVTGVVKNRAQPAMEPCCTENIILSKVAPDTK